MYVAVDERAAAPSSRDLGFLLKSLHRLPAPPIDLLVTNPLGSFLADLSQIEVTLPTGQREWLQAQGEQVIAEYQNVVLPLGHGLIHGDAHAGNLLAVGGRYMMLDWDSVSYGPRVQDFVPTLLGVIRFGRPWVNWVDLCHTYGVDPDLKDAPGMHLLCRARELRSLAAYIRAADHPDVRAELGKRLRTLIENSPEIWRAV